MKLIVTIVDDRDVDKVLATLNSQRVGVTRVSSSGGLLTPGSSTLLIGVEDTRVPHVLALIAETAAQRRAYVPYAVDVTSPAVMSSFVEVEVGGHLTFVLDIDHFEQV